MQSSSETRDACTTYIHTVYTYTLRYALEKDERGIKSGEEKRKKEKDATACSRPRFLTEAAYIISKNRARCFLFLLRLSSSRIRYPVRPARASREEGTIYYKRELQEEYK